MHTAEELENYRRLRAVCVTQIQYYKQKLDEIDAILGEKQ